MILADLVNLAVRRFKHDGDLGDLWCLRERGELIGGHGQVGAWGLVDVVAVNMNKLIVEVALELAWPSLRVKLLLGHRKGNLVSSVLCAVDVPVLTSGAFLIGFTVLRGAVDADVEDRATPKRREGGLLGEGLGEGLLGALTFGVWTFLQDGLEGCSGASTGVQHVDRRRELVGDLVCERMDIPHLVGESGPQGVLVHGGGVGKPKGLGRNPRSLPSSF